MTCHASLRRARSTYAPRRSTRALALIVMLMAGGRLAGSIDTTPPTIAAVATPAANANGWNRTNVTVKFVCSDTESGIKTCPRAQVITTEGANQTISATATDKSGNMATASITLLG